MQTGPSSSVSGHVQVSSVAELWRYPVKSMMGEELNSSDVTDGGLLGDRQFAVVDRAPPGRSAGPRARASGATSSTSGPPEPPRMGATAPRARITLPDGTEVTTGQTDLEQVLSRVFGRDVGVEEARPGQRSTGATAEEYWPDMAGLDYRDTVTDIEMPARTFFDISVVHLLTTATLDRLRALYPQGRFEVRRFRPNIVISTPEKEGFAENAWVGAP